MNINEFITIDLAKTQLITFCKNKETQILKMILSNANNKI